MFSKVPKSLKRLRILWKTVAYPETALSSLDTKIVPLIMVVLSFGLPGKRALIFTRTVEA